MPMQLLAHPPKPRVGHLRIQQAPHLRISQIGVTNDGVGKMMLIGHRLNPGHLVHSPGFGPVGLHIDRLDHAAGGHVLAKLIDQVIPANGLIFTKDARQHRAAEPGQIGFAPQVVMGVDNGYLHGLKRACS